MMAFNRRKISMYLKGTMIAASCSGFGWLAYQIYQTRLVLSNIVRPDVVLAECKRTEFIYINDPEFNILYEAAVKANRRTQRSDYFWWASSPMRWIKWWKKTLAWRLLSLAEIGNLSDRSRAVRMLSCLKHLKESDYVQLAQACDSRTAVGLARLGTDLRFFLGPLYYSTIPSQKELLEKMRSLLTSLSDKQDHPCVQYFLAKAFPEQSRYLPFDFDLASTDVPNTPPTEEEVLRLSVQSLLHHTSLGNNAKDVVSEGAFPILMDLQRYFKDDIDIQVMLCKILCYLSTQKNVLEHIYTTGFIGVLAAWAQNPVLMLSVPALQALTNLDVDENLEGKYLPRVYLLYPGQRRNAGASVDVIFVHGLLGGIFYTWRQRDFTKHNHTHNLETLTTTDEYQKYVPKVSDKNVIEYFEEMNRIQKERSDDVLKNYFLVMEDLPVGGNDIAYGPFGEDNGDVKSVDSTPTKCWPRDWLPRDCERIRVLGIDYDTSLSMWAPICPVDHKKRNLNDRSSELLEKLKYAAVGSRPIIWVAHSMGGLLVKNFILKASQSADIHVRRIAENSKAIVFYSTPHLGTPLAVLRQATKYVLWPSIEVQELRYNSTALQTLHKEFIEMLETFRMEIVSFAETKPTYVSTLKMQFDFVPVGSSDPGVGEFYEIPQDHLCICKPASRHSFLYQKVLHLIQKHMK